mgnify:CR=1 FL=1
MSIWYHLSLQPQIKMILEGHPKNRDGKTSNYFLPFAVGNTWLWKIIRPPWCPNLVYTRNIMCRYSETSLYRISWAKRKTKVEKIKQQFILLGHASMFPVRMMQARLLCWLIIYKSKLHPVLDLEFPCKPQPSRPYSWIIKTSSTVN